MEILAQKGVKDPVQKHLRDMKKTWYNETSTLIAQLIAFKRGVSGRGDQQAGLPPSNIKDPLPDEVIRYLEEMNRRYQEVSSKAAEIIKTQEQYSKNRRKSNKEIISTASNRFTRFFAWITQYPWFRNDEITKIRIDLLYSLSDFENRINDIEYLLTSIDKNAPLRAFFEFSGLIVLFDTRFVNKFEEAINKQISFYKEHKDEIGSPPKAEFNSKLEDKIKKNEEDVKKEEQTEEKYKSKTSLKITDTSINDILADLDNLIRLKDSIKELKTLDFEDIKKQYLTIRVFINEIKKKGLDENNIIELNKLYKEFVSNIAKGLGHEEATTIQELVEKKAFFLSCMIKLAEKKRLQRWLQRLRLSLFSNEFDRHRLDSAKKMRDLTNKMDEIQTMFESKGLSLMTSIQSVIEMYVLLGEVCKFFSYIGKYYNYMHGVYKINNKTHSLSRINEEQIRFLEKYAIILERKSEALSQIILVKDE